MERRHFLGGLCIGSVTLLAGCGGGDGNGTTTTAGGGDGDGTTTAGNGTPMDTATDTPADGAATTQGADTTSSPDGTTPSGTTTGPTLGEVVVGFESNYRFRVDYSDFEEQATNMIVEGTWNGGDMHMEMTYEGQTMEMYHVGGTTYMVAQGECISLDQMGGQIPDMNTDEWASTEDQQTHVEDWSDLSPSGQTTIDGESVWIFSVEAGERGNEYPLTYYVSADSGYLRRVEVQGLVIDYWDWGNVGPIDAPC